MSQVLGVKLMADILMMGDMTINCQKNILNLEVFIHECGNPILVWQNEHDQPNPN